MAFERVVGAAGLAGGELAGVMVGGRPVCVARTRDGGLFAVDDRCSHRAAALSEGQLSGTRIQCPLHRATFDLATGAPTSPPASAPIPTYRITEDGDDVLINLDERPVTQPAPARNGNRRLRHVVGSLTGWGRLAPGLQSPDGGRPRPTRHFPGPV